MKKAWTILGILLLMVVFGIAALYLALTTPKDKGMFSTDMYASEIKNNDFQTGKNYGMIADCRSAAKAGKIAIFERFEEAKGGVFEWMGCDVWYDAENNAYHVHTYRIALVPTFGGGYDAIINADGTILAVWGEE